MTEKRFKINLDFVYDSDGKLYSLNDCCDLLNDLNDENEQLKQTIQKYYDTTNEDGKQIISDLVDCFEMNGVNVDWMNKGDVE